MKCIVWQLGQRVQLGEQSRLARTGSDNLITRLVCQGTPVKLRVNVQARFLDDRNSYNMLAEIPGTDPKLRDEVVMLASMK